MNYEFTDFEKDILKKAKRYNKKILFDEPDYRVIEAVRYLVKEKIIKVVLLGNKDKYLEVAKEHNLILKENEYLTFYNMNYELKEKFVQEYFEIRKDKGITINDARKILSDSMYYACFLLKHDFIDGIVSGTIHPTRRTLKPAFEIIGTKENVKKASSFFIMLINNKIFFFADCAVNILPNEEELAEIAILTSNSCRSFGIEPRVAMLSFSTKGSANHFLVDKVRRATEIVKSKCRDLIIDGEIQVDAAIDYNVAKIKCKDSPLKGNANVLIFPNLEAGNIGYKLVQRFANAKAIGPILQGLKKPVNDLSRGCFPQEIVLVSAITALQG